MTNRLTKGKGNFGALNVPSGSLFLSGTALTATPTELNNVAKLSTRVVNGTAAGTLTITTAAHNDHTVLLNNAAGFVVNLPAATGTGTRLRFVVATTGTASYTIKAGAGDAFWGMANQVTAGVGQGTSVWGFKSGGGTVITLNGSTTGGIKGDIIELEDELTNIWFVRANTASTGTGATPFS